MLLKFSTLNDSALRLDGQPILERRPTLRKDQKLLIRDDAVTVQTTVPMNRQSIPNGHNSVPNSVNNSCASLDSVPGICITIVDYTQIIIPHKWEFHTNGNSTQIGIPHKLEFHTNGNSTR